MNRQQVTFAMLHSPEGEHLHRVLRSIYAQQGLERPTVVIGNTSFEQIPDRVQRDFPEIVCTGEKGTTGIASGRNQLMATRFLQEARYVFLLDDDIELEGHCLSRLLATLEEDPAIGLAAPLLLNRDGMVFSGGGTFWRALGQPIVSPRVPQHARTIGYATGTIGLFRREAMSRTGLFDTRFDPYGFEDVDYCLRLREQGYGIRMVPAAACRHLRALRFHEEAPFPLFHTTRNRLRCARKHVPTPWFLAGFLPWYLVRRVAFPVSKLLLRGNPSLAVHILRGAADGFMGSDTCGTTGEPET